MIYLYELDTIKNCVWRHYLNIETGLLQSYHESYTSGKLIEQIDKTLSIEEMIAFQKDYKQYLIAELEN